MGSESDGEGEGSNGLTRLPLVTRPRTCPLADEENMDDDPLLETFMDKIFYDLRSAILTGRFYKLIFTILPAGAK